MLIVFRAAYATIAVAALFSVSFLQAQQSKKVIASTTESKSSAAAAPKAKPSSAPSSRKGRTVRRRAVVKTARAPQKQIRPTNDRFSEIQEALATAGYLDGEPDGVWGQESVQALTKFQTEHSLEPTGKIDAKSLIALGLGPKYDNLVSAGEPSAPPQ